MPIALYTLLSFSSRRLQQSLLAVLFLLAFGSALPLLAQDDLTTQNATTAIDGAWITGPASNPLSYLNGPAFRTTASAGRYDAPDFAPVADLDSKLPKWIALQAEERFRAEGFSNSGFKSGSDDSYVLNRFRIQADIKTGTWFRLTAQAQDGRPGSQNPPLGPPNMVRWDLKLAYAELGAPDKHWFSLRVGRQLINYNNTILSNSEWRNQGRSYDAAVLNLNGKRSHLGIFAASVVIPRSIGVSHHLAGNNIYGIYGRIDNLLPHTALEPFVLWRVQPAAVVEPALSKSTGKQSMRAFGLRFKGRADGAFDYSGEVIVESGRVGSETIRAWAAQAGAAYQFLKSAGKPRIFTQYDFASGNSSPATNGTHSTFDTVYSTSHDRLGIADLFGWQNIKAFRLGGTLEPHRRLTVSAQALDFHAASALDAVYNSSGAAIAANKTATGSHIGQELDGYTWYELNRHFNLGGGYAWFGAGSFLSHIATAHTYNYWYIALNFKDNGKKAK